MQPATRVMLITGAVIALAWASAVTVLLARIHGQLQRIGTTFDSWAASPYQRGALSESQEFASAIRRIDQNVGQMTADVATIKIYVPYAARPR